MARRVNKEPGSYIPPSLHEHQTNTVLLQKMQDDPVTWGEALLVNRDGSLREYWDHQVEELRYQGMRVIHQDGRNVGKTINLTTFGLWQACEHGKSVLCATPHESALTTIIDELEWQLNNSVDDIIGKDVALNKAGRRDIRRRPYFLVNFKNGGCIHARQAGVDGHSFLSLHVDVLLIDEWARWPKEKAWDNALGCLNAPGIIRGYSNPNGLRNTPYFRLTEQGKKPFSEQKGDPWKTFLWPSWKNPHWTERAAENKEVEHGGRNTEGWLHMVAGEHGMPAYGVFPSEHFYACLKEPEQLADYRKISIDGSDFTGMTSQEEMWAHMDALLNLTPLTGLYVMGGDLGYTNDPVELCLFQEVPLMSRGDDGSERSKLSLVLRVHCEHVAYPLISMLIALIDRHYTPYAIGIDNGGNGGSVYQELMTLDTFRGNGFEGRLEGFDFGSVTEFAKYDEGTGQSIVIRKPTKEEMTKLINGWLVRRELELPKGDTDFEDQFMSQTYSIGSGGRILYSKGNDHVIDAVRCAALAREKKRTAGYSQMQASMRVIDMPLPVMVRMGGY